MRAFRLAKRQYLTDLSGEGARLYGGRWNKKGTAALYASESRSLAALEYLVHVPRHLLPVDVWLAELDLPVSGCETLSQENLPSDWRAYPAPNRLVEIGTSWLENAATLCVKVPSAVVKDEWNLLINPRHPLTEQIRILSIEEFSFDRRFFDIPG